jgi:hypothetical protein
MFDCDGVVSVRFINLLLFIRIHNPYISYGRKSIGLVPALGKCTLLRAGAAAPREFPPFRYGEENISLELSSKFRMRPFKGLCLLVLSIIFVS